MTFLDGSRPRAFAHRGWHTGDLAGCENSLAAFRRAVEEGYHYLETDVHLTADGVLVAFHDTVLDRVTDARGPIARHTFAELRSARIGGREPIPTMAEVLQACPDARFNIDPKADAAVGPLLDLLDELRARERVCVGAFSDRRLRAVRGAAGPALATSLGPREVFRLVVSTRFGARRSVDTRSRTDRSGPAQAGGGRDGGVIAAQVPVRYGPVIVTTPRFVRAAHRAGLEVHVWTVDDPSEMDRLLDLGVDGIMTDRPDRLRDVLRRRGAWS